MGAKNVKLVEDNWYDLPDKPYRLLTHMARRSMDGGDPPIYWGGCPYVELKNS